MRTGRNSQGGVLLEAMSRRFACQPRGPNRLRHGLFPIMKDRSRRFYVPKVK
jgi:hypothetical protein